MLYLLLESIFIYGDIDENIDILIYTNTEFMEIIKKSSLYCANIKFEINNNINTLDKACKSRLDICNFESAKIYNRIMYLDTDIIVKSDIKKIFNLIQDDLLYVVKEGSLELDESYWGKYLFSNEELNSIEDKTAFTSSILLFNNSEKMINFFKEIKNDICKRSNLDRFHDQPFIVYNAFKLNIFDNKVLNDYAHNYGKTEINNNYTLIHFAGPIVGGFDGKYEKMNNFINNHKEDKIMKNINIAKEFITQNLLPIIYSIGEPLEGNIFMIHHTTIYTDWFINKTKNISNCLLNQNIKNVMEIGFNSGFSTLLMLISNKNVKITCVDLCEHQYTIPCFIKIKEFFGDRLELVSGDSTKTLMDIHKKYDLIHIDGGHSNEVAQSDINNSIRLSKNGTILIMDDYDFGNLHELWDKYIGFYNLKPLDIYVYNSPHHDIKYISI